MYRDIFTNVLLICTMKSTSAVHLLLSEDMLFKDAGQLTNSAGPDQTAPLGAV